MCFQMYWVGLDFLGLCIDIVLNLYNFLNGLSTQPNVFTVLTTKETGRRRLLWHMKTIANHQ